MADVVAPVIREVSRLEETVRARMETEDALHTEVAALRTEVAGLRAAVAHLRCSGAPVPSLLQPVVARAVLAQDAS